MIRLRDAVAHRRWVVDRHAERLPALHDRLNHVGALSHRHHRLAPVVAERRLLGRKRVQPVAAHVHRRRSPPFAADRDLVRTLAERDRELRRKAPGIEDPCAGADRFAHRDRVRVGLGCDDDDHASRRGHRSRAQLGQAPPSSWPPARVVACGCGEPPLGPDDHCFTADPSSSRRTDLGDPRHRHELSTRTSSDWSNQADFSLFQRATQ